MSITMKYKANSGITPIEYNVVVKPEKVEERTKGGLFLPDQAHDTDQHGHQRGTVDAVGGEAFAFENAQKWNDAPKPGDRVIFIKYAGTLVQGDDGEDYRVMKDKDVLGVLA